MILFFVLSVNHVEMDACVAPVGAEALAVYATGVLQLINNIPLNCKAPEAIFKSVGVPKPASIRIPVDQPTNAEL